jgi:predicted double-glycine peptidase
MTQRQRAYFARVTLGGFAIAGLLCAGAGLVFSSSDLLKQVSAKSMGAVYLGSDGVELQRKRNDCGPASLKMIFDHVAIHAPLGELTEELALTRTGTSMLALKEAAERRGLHAEGWRLTTRGLVRVPSPAVLLIHGDHFVVMDSVSTDYQIFIRDPALGRLRMSLHRLARVWRGETLVFFGTTDTRTEANTKLDFARWSTRNNQMHCTPRIVPRGVLQEDGAGGWDATGRMTNQP